MGVKCGKIPQQFLIPTWGLDRHSGVVFYFFPVIFLFPLFIIPFLFALQAIFSHLFTHLNNPEMTAIANGVYSFTPTLMHSLLNIPEMTTMAKGVHLLTHCSSTLELLHLPFPIMEVLSWIYSVLVCCSGELIVMLFQQVQGHVFLFFLSYNFSYCFKYGTFVFILLGVLRIMPCYL